MSEKEKVLCPRCGCDGSVEGKHSEELKEKLRLAEEALGKVKDCHEEGSVHLGVNLYGYVLNALLKLRGDK